MGMIQDKMGVIAAAGMQQSTATRANLRVCDAVNAAAVHKLGPVGLRVDVISADTTRTATARTETASANERTTLAPAPAPASASR